MRVFVKINNTKEKTVLAKTTLITMTTRCENAPIRCLMVLTVKAATVLKNTTLAGC